MSASPGLTLPWEGKAARADRVIVAMIALSGIYSFATLPLVPWLITHHPVVLAAIRGGMAAIVTVGAHARTGDVSFVTAVLVGLPATVMFDWAYWWAGRRWGERSLHMMLGDTPRTDIRLARVKHMSERYGVGAVLLAYYLPVPTFLIYAAAGWAGMSLAKFLVLDIVGALMWTGLLAGLGYWIGQSAVDAVDAISKYALWITIGLVVVVIVRQVIVTRRQLRDLGPGASGEPATAPAE